MWYAGAGDVVQLVRSDWAFLAFVSVETLERTSLQKAFPWCPSPLEASLEPTWSRRPAQGGPTKDCHFFANTVITRDPAPLARYQPAQSSE